MDTGIGEMVAADGVVFPETPNPCYESGNLTWELNTWLTH